MNTAVTVMAGAASGPRPLVATAVYFLAFVAQGMIGAVLAPTLPGLVAQAGAPLSALSMLFAMRALGSLAGAAQGGRLYDRLPGHPVMALALLSAAALVALLPLSYGLWYLVAVVTLIGAATSVLNLGGNTLLAWVQRDHLAPYMNALHFCFGLGAFLSPLLVAWLMGADGDSALALWVLAGLLLPVAGLLLGVPSPRAPLRQEGGVAAPVDNKLLILFVVFFCFYVGAEVSFGSLLYTYAVDMDLTDAAGGALLTGAFWGALTCGRLLAVPLAARTRPRHVLAVDLLGALAGVGLILALPASVAALWTGTLLTGFAMASVFPTALTFVQRRIPVSGRVTGWFMVGSGVGSIGVPWLIGGLMDSLGVRGIVWVVAASLLLTLAVFTVLMAGWREPVRVLEVRAVAD